MSTLFLRGGPVHLPDGAPPASALLVDGSTVAWIGDAADAPDADEVLDLGGALVLPGFCDAHVHLTMTGQGLDGVDLSGTTSVTQALALVEQAARSVRGRPIYAHSWDETRWGEQRPVTSAELDRASYGGVVYMPRVDAHSACVSTAMATIARVTDLDGWDGTGVATREAFAAVTNAFTSSLTQTDRERHVGLALASAARHGITLLHETGAPHLTSHDDLRSVLEAGQAPDVPDVVTYWGEIGDDAAAVAELTGYLGVLGLAGDLCADGSFGSFTAHLSEPYTGTEEHGWAYLTVEEVRDHVVACTRAGVQAGGHVIGDAALRTMAEGVRLAAQVVGPDAVRAARHRWEHVELPDADVLAAMADLGIWASVQPMFDGLWGGADGMYAARLGVDRALAAVPLRDMLDAGVRIALGSDSPITPLGPWAAVRAAVRHHNPAQRLTVAEAFAAHTRGGYELAGREGGRLRVGGPATYVVWDDGAGGAVETDPTTGLPVLDGPDRALPVARRTVVAGVTAYQREGA
ncbi:amidohydrolase [Ornithinimicrobium avium]|uniref:Amidohydrolase n=1 Tax=Ornithinimicrobium avium TaxID=2283195 RepID=A0A345NJM6_9MICO|nr:amidohydrolase family protein [Ornithinimicrobium avium]AXH95234.1 amidohydrolase [Ornithinimicrobium avium]